MEAVDNDDLAATACILFQAVSAIWIWSAWTWRYALKTAFRPGNTSNRVAEFKSYGMSPLIMKIVGVCEVGCATLLTIGIFFPTCGVLLAGSIGLAVIMLGAVGAHVSVRDPPMKSTPAAFILLMSSFVAGFSVMEMTSGDCEVSELTDLLSIEKLSHVLLACHCAPMKTTFESCTAISTGQVGSFQQLLAYFTCLLTSEIGRWSFGLMVLVGSGVMLYRAYNAGVYRRRFSSSGLLDANVKLLEELSRQNSLASRTNSVVKKASTAIDDTQSS